MTGVAVINAGSSSIKLAIYEQATAPALLVKGHVDGLGTNPQAKVFDASGQVVASESLPADIDHDQATQVIVKMAAERLGQHRIVATGHRVVHGGPRYAAPMVVTDDLITELEAFVPLAPLHQPHNLAPIRTIRKLRPDMRQVVCFDTAFHRSQPPVAQQFALPRAYAEEGVRRYGFHGISYEFVSARLAELAPHLADGRVVIAHLGNGASLCAVHKGRSVASTMGFTAVDGLVMGTRSGSLDPGVLIYLMDRHGFGAREIEDLLYKKSGLLGVSGISSDMRTLRASADPLAKEAIDLFVYRIVREIGSLAAALGGLDALVFTAGIGENDAATRAEVAAGCAWLGVKIDDAKNASAAFDLSDPGATVKTLRIPTNEELRIALATIKLATSA